MTRYKSIIGQPNREVPSVLLLLLFCISCVSAVFGQPGLDSSSSNLSDKISQIMNPLVSSNNYAGNVLVIKDGETLFSESYGMMDEQNQLSNMAETKYFLASASMMFTSAALMKLVDEGKLSTSDKLSRFFPDYKDGDKITIHHMLAQRSGIPAWDGGMRLTNFNRNKPHTITELIEYFKDDELLFEPGSDYSHGRSEYILLAAIIEQISGKTFGDYLEESVFKPLEMHNSGHYSNTTRDEDIPYLAKGYTELGFTEVTDAPKIHWSVKTGHASIYSSIGDMKKFADAVIKKQLLSSDSWDQVFTDHGKNVGYGWFLPSQTDQKSYQMNGRSPGFASFIGIYPEDGLTVIMLSNRYVSLPYFIGPEIAAAALGDEFDVLNLSTEDVDADFAKTITGHYKMGPDFYRPNGTVNINYRDGRMYSGSYPLIPVLDDEGQILAFIHRHYWSRLEFSTSDDGKTVLHFDNYIGQKQGLLKEWIWVIFGLSVLVLVVLIFAWRRIVRSRHKIELATSGKGI